MRWQLAGVLFLPHQFVCLDLFGIPRLLKHCLHIFLNSQLQVNFALFDKHLCDDVVSLRNEVLRLCVVTQVEQILADNMKCNSVLGHHFVVELHLGLVSTFVSSLLKRLTFLYIQCAFKTSKSALCVFHGNAVVLQLLLQYSTS